MQVTDSTARAPALFISHGSPMAALQEDDFGAALRGFAQLHPMPRGIVVLSAHWLSAGPIQVTTNPRSNLIYDFTGFPEALYEVKYPASGSPGLALNVMSLLGEAGYPTLQNRDRGWDHGVWMPLRAMYPSADIPIVQISLPIVESARELLRIGHTLSALRQEGVMLVGSGGMVHNLSKLQWSQKDAMVNAWALKFAAWVKDRLERADIEALLDFQKLAPESSVAHPTIEHFLPLFFISGSSISGDRIRTVFDGFQYGNLSLFCFSLEP